MKKYYECTIQPHYSGFGMYECNVGDEAWEDESDLLSEIYNNVEEILELGVDDLPDEIEDIRGKIYNEPTRVFAVKDKWNDWSVIGILEVEEE